MFVIGLFVDSTSRLKNFEYFAGVTVPGGDRTGRCLTFIRTCGRLTRTNRCEVRSLRRGWNTTDESAEADIERPPVNSSRGQCLLLSRAWSGGHSSCGNDHGIRRRFSLPPTIPGRHVPVAVNTSRDATKSSSRSREISRRATRPVLRDRRQVERKGRSHTHVWIRQGY